MNTTVFIIGTVWVEPKSSAAGSRMLQLIRYFQTHNYKVVFGTTAQKNPNSIDLESLGIDVFSLQLNHTSFDVLLKEINPEIVLFDRFLTEEQFGWRVSEILPKAIRILDTEDLHYLRKVREEAYKKQQEFQFSDLLEADISKREIASILRCDLSLMISQYEIEVLQDTFNIDLSLLFYVPFLIDSHTEIETKTFKERNHFVSIGNFLHAPNLESVITLKNDIWKGIRIEVPTAEIHLYGAYPNQQVLEFNNPKEGFYVHGFVENIDEVLQNSKVLLAPLSFGAGLKGKFIDGMKNGCPSVTTKIGIEGYSEIDDWCGLVANNWEEFTKKSIELYTNETLWNQSQEKGFELLKQFDKNLFYESLTLQIEFLKNNLKNHRKNNFIGSLLQHHTLKSTKYLSKWIEEKNKPT